MSLQVTDDDGATDVATSSITVASNLPPIANPDGAGSDGNPDPICVSPTGTTIDVLANDDDPDNPNDGEDVFLIGHEDGEYGTVDPDHRGTKTLSDDRFTYTSTVDNGLDTFTYTIGDVDGATSSTTVYVDPGVCGNVTVNFQTGGETLPAGEAAGASFTVTYDANDDGVSEPFASEGQANQSFNLPLYQVKRTATLLTDLAAGDLAPPDGYELSNPPVDKDTELDDVPGFDDDYPTDPSDPDFAPENFTRSNLGLDFSVNDAPTACFSFIPAYPATGESVDFDAACSSDPDGDDTIVSYKWDKNSTTFEEAHRIGEMMTTSFSKPGDHAITLQVTDDAGAIATTSQIVSISDGSGGGQCQTINVTNFTSYAPGSASVGCTASQSSGTDQKYYYVELEAGIDNQFPDRSRVVDKVFLDYTLDVSSADTAQASNASADIYGYVESTQIGTDNISVSNGAADYRQSTITIPDSAVDIYSDVNIKSYADCDFIGPSSPDSSGGTAILSDVRVRVCDGDPGPPPADDPDDSYCEYPDDNRCLPCPAGDWGELYNCTP